MRTVFKKTKLRRKTLDELTGMLDVLLTEEQRLIIGGGSGTYDDPYTEAELDQMLTSGTFHGGYVIIDGVITWCLPPSYCVDNSEDDPDLGILASYASSTTGLVGEALQHSSWTYRLTNSQGTIDFHYYSNGWSGNQYVNSGQPIGLGKVMKVSGMGSFLHSVSSLFGAVSISMDVYNAIIAKSPADKWMAYIDGAVDLLSFIPYGVGPVLSISYSAFFRDEVRTLVENYLEDDV